MNRVVLPILLGFSLFAISQNFTPVDEGSKVHFVIKNFGINTGGQLSGLKGKIVFDPNNLEASEFDVSVDVKTIDTDSENRDEHLRSESYFDADKYPVITIKSTKISGDKSNGSYDFFGTLTIKGVSRNIFFPFTATQRGNDYLFSGEFEINRLDYSVGESSSVLGKTVKVSLSVLGRKG